MHLDYWRRRIAGDMCLCPQSTEHSDLHIVDIQQIFVEKFFMKCKRGMRYGALNLYKLHYSGTDKIKRNKLNNIYNI